MDTNITRLAKAVAATLCQLAHDPSGLPEGELSIMMMTEGFDLNDTLMVIKIGIKEGYWTSKNHLLEPTAKGKELGQRLIDALEITSSQEQPKGELN